MDKERYKHTLTAAMKDHADLTELRAEVDKRLARLKETITCLTKLLGTSDLDVEQARSQLAIPADMGLSDLCRQVLQLNGGWMSVSHIRSELASMGINVKDLYSNPGAVLHTTLKRLHESGDLDMNTDDEQGKMYKWVGRPSPRTAIVRGGKQEDDSDDIPW